MAKYDGDIHIFLLTDRLSNILDYVCFFKIARAKKGDTTKTIKKWPKNELFFSKIGII